MSTFDASNTLGAKVFDVEARRILDRVVLVDTTAGVVVRDEYPLRVVGDEIAQFTERFETIYPIYGGRAKPVLFHCYGRKPQGDPGDATQEGAREGQMVSGRPA